ncbi:T9SS type A sorting domain-containing protein [Tamlana agarivorans]|uniref:T9SS type A sorting domain-containing protein n=1 Tax=Pseudotamlana agarivorans TaxID=481183 RepID=A0ACC5U7Z6_9FLAO|nr:T9SS type A sorting domain-containing protein [Tamlana agarivorans]MBU2950417.1 T9SS type A sorting domain-containing protein [Tamlana agarivorans]
MIKNFLIAFMFISGLALVEGQTVLGVNEVMITGYNADDKGADQFTFVVLTDIDPGRIIKFTDIGWSNSLNRFISGGGNSNAEGVLEWTAPATGIDCGTEVFLFTGTGVNQSDWTCTFGTATETDIGFGLQGVNDQIIAFDGNFSSPVMVHAIMYGARGWGDTAAADAQFSDIPPGLTDGPSAIYYGNNTSGAYDCSTVIGISDIETEIAVENNWNLLPRRTVSTDPPVYLPLGGCNYSCCPSNIWDGSNWSLGVVPTINESAILTADYDTFVNGPLETCSLFINAGATLRVREGAYVEVDHDVTVDGNLEVDSESNFVQNYYLGNFTDNSSGGVKLTKTKVSNSNVEYTYWSSPVANTTIENALAGTPSGRRYWFNAANFEDLLAEQSGNAGVYVAGQDDIDDDGDDWQRASGAMIPGVGYASFPKSGSNDYDFVGTFNTAEITVPVVANSPSYTNWNLIGNPYPGAISADDFLTENTSLLNGTIYFWDQVTAADAGTIGNEQQNFSQDDYAFYNLSGGTGTAGAGNSGVHPNGYIACGQSFFVAAINSGDVVFKNSMRGDTYDNTQFFKVSNNKQVGVVNEKLWVNLTSNNGVFSQVLVAYIDGATNGFDGEAYDAKLLNNKKFATLYTQIPNDASKFKIQGKAKQSIDIHESIALGFDNHIAEQTEFTISLDRLQGHFLSVSPIYLQDKALNVTHNLVDSGYTFVSDVTGDFSDRFQIVFNAKALSVEKVETAVPNFFLGQTKNQLMCDTNNKDIEIENIQIYDMLGRLQADLEINATETQVDISHLSHAIYVVQVQFSNGESLRTKIIN